MSIASSSEEVTPALSPSLASGATISRLLMTETDLPFS